MNLSRRWRAIGAFVLAVGVGLAALTSCGSASATATDAGDVTSDPPVTMMVMGSTATPKGVWEISIEFSNPGSDPVRVTSHQVDATVSAWQKATVIVPAGGTTKMTIHGQGPQGCEAMDSRFSTTTGTTPPWDFGEVRAEGVVIMPVEDVWC